MYVIQASPFSKIFTKEWERKCLEDPALMELSKPKLFDIRIKRPTAGIVLQHLVPVHASTLINKTSNPKETLRRIEEDEVGPLVAWLTGGPEQRNVEETDIYGVVAIEIDDVFQDTIKDLMAMALAQPSLEEQQKFIAEALERQKKMAATLDVKMKDAIARANERVKRAVLKTHENLLRAWENMRQQGQNPFVPSPQESLGYKIFKTEIDRRLEMNRKMTEMVAEGIPGAVR